MIRSMQRPFGSAPRALEVWIAFLFLFLHKARLCLNQWTRDGSVFTFEFRKCRLMMSSESVENNRVSDSKSEMQESALPSPRLGVWDPPSRI
jgi:hypothetical protein